MINIKHNLLINMASYFRTLKNKKWLDSKGYIYTLNIFDFFKNDKKRIKVIKKMLNGENTGTQSKYVIYLVKFDTYGNYQLPNKIYLNIYQPLNKIVKVLRHEIEHLKVEDRVTKDGLSHEEKEKMVDMIEKHKK